MKPNISKIDYCYGCGVCTLACPLGLITLEKNYDGFFQPVINNIDKCIGCGKCLNVCSLYNKKELYESNVNHIFGYASWSKNSVVRQKSSSGGTGFEIASFLVENGYKFVGVRYNAGKSIAEHYIATKQNELFASMGSKYIQSFTEDAFHNLKKGKKYLITGTPCQIASLRRFLKISRMESDVVLMDFFCHGVPTLNLWLKYLKEVEKVIGKIKHASWRDKMCGWHDSWVMTLNNFETDLDSTEMHKSDEITKTGTIFKRKMSDGDIFYKFFLGNMCFNKSCYKDCRFKYLSSCADIRIGDLWGKKYENNSLGVTGVLALTEIGNDILHRCNVELISEPIEVVTEGQMKKTLRKPYYYSFLMWLFHTPLKLVTIYRIVQILRLFSILKHKLNIA